MGLRLHVSLRLMLDSHMWCRSLQLLLLVLCNCRLLIRVVLLILLLIRIISRILLVVLLILLLLLIPLF